MRLLAAALALLLAAPAGASTLTVAVDPRIELLGVVQRLAGAGDPGREDSYARDADAAFARFKRHPAVKLYAKIRERAGGREGLGIDLLYYTAPPALALRDPEAPAPYMRDGEDQRLLQEFLAQLRAFAEKSRFQAFFDAHRPLYASLEGPARARFTALDPAARIEKYLGVGLKSDCLYALALLYRNSSSSSFIEPYPDASVAPRPVKSFSVYSILPFPMTAQASTALLDDDLSGPVWQEPLYVFVDPSLHFFERANVDDPAAFYGPDLAACRTDSVNCVKAYLIAALVARLNLAAYGRRVEIRPALALKPRVLEELDRRLAAFEADRKRWPTLWSYYPRLFSVFPELAGAPARGKALRVPAPAPADAAGFFAADWRASAEPARP